MGKKIKPRNNKPEKIHISDNRIEIDYPVFCFKHLQSKPDKDYKFYAEFIQRLKQISSLTWGQINGTQRHGFGTEKIPKKQIKPDMPPFVSPDVDDLIVFRANGDNRPFLGLRSGSVFHVIFLEEKFGDVYDH